jgi:hypothetical protein
MPLIVEFFGIPRARAGVALLALDDADRPATLGELWRALATRLPEFGAQCISDGRLAPHYTANLDGRRFARDPDTTLGDVSHVLVLSSDAGG